MNSRLNFRLIAVLSVTIPFYTASAVPLTAPGFIVPASEGEPGVGAVLLASLISPFSDPGRFSGTLTTQVYQDPGNGLGGLTFTYLLENSASSLDDLGRLSVDNYAGALTDVSTQGQAVGDVVPNFVTRNTSDVIGWDFLSGITPGSRSALLVVETDQPSYDAIHAHVINGGDARVPSLAPATGVPDSGATAGLLGAGIFAVAMLRKRLS